MATPKARQPPPAPPNGDRLIALTVKQLIASLGAVMTVLVAALTLYTSVLVPIAVDKFRTLAEQEVREHSAIPHPTGVPRTEFEARMRAEAEKQTMAYTQIMDRLGRIERRLDEIK